MANALYNAGRQKFLEGGIAYLTDTIKIIGVATTGTTPYTFSQTHANLSDVPAGSILAAAQALATKTSTNGTAGAANVTFPSVPAGTTPIGALILYKDTGTSTTSTLVAYIDTASGLPVTPNGGSIIVQWDATNGILTL